MGFEEAQIILNSPNGAYYSGQTVRGKFEFDLDKIETFRGIYVDISGWCKVHWITTHEEERFGHKETRTVYHNAYEEYFNGITYMIGGATDEIQLQPGHYIFPFMCQLPPKCPSSYEGVLGHIRYQVKVVIDRAFQSVQRVAAFRVFVPIDINQNPLCSKPIDMEITNTYCCWCISSGTTETLVKLPVSGYCPGQVIPLEVSCNNSSNVNIKSIRLTLKQAINFHADQSPGIKTVKDKIAEIKTGPIPGNNNRRWTVQMKIPAMDVYNFDGCRYIDVYNYFKVTVETGRCHENGRDSRQIIIGTIPLRGFQDDVENPLKDQMPSEPYKAETENVQDINAGYTVINQPLPRNTGYPVSNYPNDTPYPQPVPLPYPTGNGGPSIGFNTNGDDVTKVSQNAPCLGNSSYVETPPYPISVVNTGYKVLSNIGTNPPYPVESHNIDADRNPAKLHPNPPYPVDSPNVGTDLHSLHPNPPYPVETSNIGTNSELTKLYTNPKSPYNSRGPSQSSYSSQSSNIQGSFLKTGTVGFIVQPNVKPDDNASTPLLPSGPRTPYPLSSSLSPYARASAPEASTLDKE